MLLPLLLSGKEWRVLGMSMTQLLSCLELPGSNMPNCTCLLLLCSVLALFEAGALEEQLFAVGDSFTVVRPDMRSGDMLGSYWMEDRKGSCVLSSPVSSSLSLHRIPLLIAVLSKAASKARSPLDFPLSCWTCACTHTDVGLGACLGGPGFGRSCVRAPNLEPCAYEHVRTSFAQVRKSRCKEMEQKAQPKHCHGYANDAANALWRASMAMLQECSWCSTDAIVTANAHYCSTNAKMQQMPVIQQSHTSDAAPHI
eukprot:scaffold223078_cov22-Tisochrysis_lutea.AAC.1